MPKYVAFLRGINVGGNKPVKMSALQDTFASLGFRDVRTVLASGNVVFSAPSSNTQALTTRIERTLRADFGHDIRVVLRPLDELQRLADAQPFKRVKVAPTMMLYVTFFPELRSGTTSRKKRELRSGTTSRKKRELRSGPTFPAEVTIVRKTPRELCAALSPRYHTTDFMTLLDRAFGRTVTTRNWNTVAKLLES